MIFGWNIYAVLIPLLYLLLVALVAYWVIRKAIAHGLADYDRKKSPPTP